MTRLMIAPVLVLGLGFAYGCSGGPKATTPTTPTSGSGSGSDSGPVVLAKKISISFGVVADGEMADIFLAITDETGKVTSHSVGRYKGACAASTPAKEMNALIGVTCKAGSGGTELHAMVRGGDEIIVLQMGLADGVTPDPMAREQVTTVKVPLGVSIQTGN